MLSYFNFAESSVIPCCLCHSIFTCAFTTNDFTVLLLLLLLNYLLTLEDSAKTEKSKLGRNLNSRLIGPLSLLFRACSFSYFVNTSVSLVQLCTIRRIKIEKLFLLFFSMFSLFVILLWFSGRLFPSLVPDNEAANN